MQKQWIFPDTTYEGDIVEYLLKCRGVVESEAMEEFLSPKPQLTYNLCHRKGRKNMHIRRLRC